MNLAEARRCFRYSKQTGIVTRIACQYRPDTIGQPVGYLTAYGYLAARIQGRSVLLHRFIWWLVTGEWPAEVDHKNRKRADNRWRNLRDANRSKNRANSRAGKNNKLGIKGVRLTIKGRYEPRLRVDGRALWLGTYKTAREAAAVYAKAARQYFGPFACAG